MVEIYTLNTDSYKRSTSVKKEEAEQDIKANKKEIKIRWVHLKDGNPIDMNIEKNQKDIQYEIRWYKYRVGAAAADPYCGIYWERMCVKKENIDGKDVYLLCDLAEDQDDYGELRQFTNLIFNPDVNKQQEKIKAIIIYENNTPYRSNELIFENEE
jgi:hypothetical protein